MILGNIELYKNILLYILLPITIIFCLFVLFSKISKKRNAKILFQLTYILFTLYFIYALFLSFYELVNLKRIRTSNHKLLVIIWIVIPFLPGLAMIYFGRKYKSLKKED